MHVAKWVLDLPERQCSREDNHPVHPFMDIRDYQDARCPGLDVPTPRPTGLTLSDTPWISSIQLAYGLQRV